ncbi:hypothetical protein JXA47_15975 [Candidatus Sumerlaeota bacterium]|nr:hypothetical protein [Candidatus Sumerlaeota bacterium]
MKHNLLSAALLLGFALLVVSAPGATIWYVDGTTGSDLTGTGTAGNPWATIQHAIDHPSVLDGDSVLVAMGSYPENLNIHKGIALGGSGVEILLTSLSASSEGVGVAIASDNVELYGLTFTPAVGIDEGGSLVYAYDPGDGAISGLVIDGCYFDTEGTAPPAGVDGLTCLTLHNPVGAQVGHSDFVIDGGILGTRADNAILCFAGSADGVRNNSILGNHITSYSTAGIGIGIRPGTGDSDDAGAANFDLVDNYISWGIGTAIELRDEETGASEGITDILLEHNSMYYDDTAIRIHGLANDPGAGISDVRICRNVDLYNTIANGCGLHISQTGTGTTNIDFGSIRMRGSTFAGHSICGVLNDVPGAVFDARYNAWGSDDGPDDDAGIINGTGDRISTGVDATSFITGTHMNSGFTEVTSAGATGEIDISAANIRGAVKIDLDPGVTGEVDMSLVAHSSGIPQGYTGIVNGKGLDYTMIINSDLADGDFVALLEYHCNSFLVTTMMGVSEEDVLIYSWDELGPAWVPTVFQNTTGTPTWLGVSPPPSPPYGPHLGEHGVDTANDFAWAVVDHFTEFTAGEGISGVPVELSVFSGD